jgi:3-oxoacyl-[acyl-carrier-protein] synthase-1
MSESAHIKDIDEAAKDLNILTSIKEGAFDTAMSNSFGFGGTNATLVMQKIT